MTKIFHGGIVIAEPDEPFGTKKECAVIVEDQKVLAVMPINDARKHYPQAELIGNSETLIMPGFVDGHHHQGVVPIRLGARNMSLERVFTHRRVLRGPSLYDDTLYGAVQMLMSGITTVNHLHVNRGGDWQAWERDYDDILRGYADAGLRVNLVVNYRNQNIMTYGGDETFIDEINPRSRKIVADLIGSQKPPLDEFLKSIFLSLWEKIGRNQGSKARVAISPHNMHWCTDEAIVKIVNFAREHHLRINIHLLESARQKQYAYHRTGKTAISHLAELGVLGSDINLLHGVWATQSDIETLARYKVRVCTSPNTNLAMGVGIAPIGAMLDAGVPLSIGLDEGGINSDWDVFSEMRLVRGLSNDPFTGRVAMSSSQALSMATVGSAEQTEFANHIGRIRPGYFADLVLINWRDVNAPIGATGPTPIDDLVYKARRTHIGKVFVGGVERVSAGRHTSVNLQSVSDRIRRFARLPLSEKQAEMHLALSDAQIAADRYWKSYEWPTKGAPFVLYNGTE